MNNTCPHRKMTSSTFSPLICCFIKFTSSLLTHVSVDCTRVCLSQFHFHVCRCADYLPSSIQFNKFSRHIGSLWNCTTGSGKECVCVCVCVCFDATPWFRRIYWRVVTVLLVCATDVLTQVSNWLILAPDFSSHEISIDTLGRTLIRLFSEACRGSPAAEKHNREW